MGKRDKLIQKFLRRPPSVRFDEVASLLKSFGFIEARVRGSHHTFRRDLDGLIITVPKKHGQVVKRTYVIQIIELLDLENNG
ncbi:MAG: type II toxin-antitoxin system HicA family toxin [Acaryochloridaceae cyanobacterium RL_2_7]|nr:type II toxin-antitoxin system HicA family toxin [Acaryochloridaceae cyanobacterium RL_2_7]